jgi:hypothetical protein
VRQVEFTAVASCVSHRDTRSFWPALTAGARAIEDGAEAVAALERLGIACSCRDHSTAFRDARKVCVATRMNELFAREDSHHRLSVP